MSTAVYQSGETVSLHKQDREDRGPAHSYSPGETVAQREQNQEN